MKTSTSTSSTYYDHDVAHHPQHYDIVHTTPLGLGVLVVVASSSSSSSVVVV